jgi:hypothetical protein
MLRGSDTNCPIVPARWSSRPKRPRSAIRRTWPRPNGRRRTSNLPVMPSNRPMTFTAAVAQAGSIAFDTPATITKLTDLAADARNDGADLVVFPEAFVGG